VSSSSQLILSSFQLPSLPIGFKPHLIFQSLNLKRDKIRKDSEQFLVEQKVLRICARNLQNGDDISDMEFPMPINEDTDVRSIISINICLACNLKYISRLTGFV